MILRTEEISKHFGGLHAVDRVDFTLKEGQLKSIIGPNGAGKTTLFNLIAGVHEATGGKVFFRDRDITRMSLHQTSRLGITKTYQITHIFPGLSVFENVRIAAQSRVTSFNFWRSSHSLSALNEKAIDILEQVELLEKRNRLASTLSHGERRYLEIGIALATDPKVLLLDEPTAGMSVAETAMCAGLIRRLNRELNLSIVLVEHDMSVVMGISEEILVLNEGRVLAEGTPQEVSDNREVQRVYLGEEKYA
ncbi:MAG: ABC transporter ATP-binding protein [Deltaproteobacteria bacterium]|nr:ABC transporter ATP-binding protein [Deltaproteobacteria bacterium]